jgi:hypothetical protein
MGAQAAAKSARDSPIAGFETAQYTGPGWESVDEAVKAGELNRLA